MRGIKYLAAACLATPHNSHSFFDMDERTIIISAIIAVALCGCGAFAYSRYSSNSSKPNSSEAAKPTLGAAAITGPQQQAAAGVQGAIEQLITDQPKDKAKKWQELLKTTFPIATNICTLWCISSMAEVSFWPPAIISAASAAPAQAIASVAVSIAVFNLIQGVMLNKEIAGKRVSAAISGPAGIFGGYLAHCVYAALVPYFGVAAPALSLASAVVALMSFTMYQSTLPPPLPPPAQDAPGDPDWFLDNNWTTDTKAQMCETGVYNLVNGWASTVTTLVQDKRNSGAEGDCRKHHRLFLCPSGTAHNNYPNYGTLANLLIPSVPQVTGAVKPDDAVRDILCALTALVTKSNKPVFASLHSGGMGFVDGVTEKKAQRVVVDFNPESDKGYVKPTDGATAITDVADTDALLDKLQEIAKSHQGVCLHMSQDKKTLHVWGRKAPAVDDAAPAAEAAA
jgi:hypothetical protein